VGYTLFDTLPDHCTLERFELWLNHQQHFAIFDEIVHQIRQDFPEETRMTQIGDTYAMRANAASEELRPMIRHVCTIALQKKIWKTGLDWTKRWKYDKLTTLVFAWPKTNRQVSAGATTSCVLPSDFK
jgi:hypothetical protein